jgi:hypothetical protein
MESGAMSDEATPVGPVPGAEGDTPPGQREAAALASRPPDGSTDPDLARITRNPRLVPFEVGLALNRLGFSTPQLWIFPSDYWEAEEDAREVGRRAYFLRPSYEERCALQAEVVGLVEDLLANAGREHRIDAWYDFEGDLKNPFRYDPYPPDDPDFDAARNDVCDDFFRPAREVIDQIRRDVCAGLGDRDRALLGLGELVDQGLRRPDAHRFLCRVEWIDDESGARDGSGRRRMRPTVTLPRDARRPGGVPPREDWADQIIVHAHDLGIEARLPEALLRRPGPDDETEAGRVARVEGLVAAVRLALEDRSDPGGEETGPGATGARDDGSDGTAWRPLRYLGLEVDDEYRHVRRPGVGDLRFEGRQILFHIFLILANARGECAGRRLVEAAWERSGRLCPPSTPVLNDAVCDLRGLLADHPIGLEIPDATRHLGWRLVARAQDSPPRPTEAGR